MPEPEQARSRDRASAAGGERDATTRPDAAIVVAGEALIDLVPRGPQQLAAHAGGGPYNTARALARLGQPVRFLGCLSDDRFGAQLREQLTRDGVCLDAVVTTTLPTTLALAELDGSGAASYRFYTEGTAAPALTPTDALAALAERTEVLHLGTLALAMEPIASTLQHVVQAVRPRGLVMVDPNCRPSFTADRVGYRRRLSAMLARAHIVKASADDLAYLEPSRTTLDAARVLLERGCEVVLVTRGTAGASVVSRSSELRVPAPAAHVVDTIGAGDAFGAGFLAWWRSRGLSTRELADPEALGSATRFACLVAARTCERPGADPPRLSELRAELER